MPLLAQQEPLLTVPATPAFSILNLESSSILKPGSLKDLGGDVINSFDKEGKPKLNIGMELTPYWLTSKPTLTSNEYNHPGFKQRILQSLNISAATVKDTLTNKTKLGLGIRFQLLNGRPAPEYLEKQQELVQLLTVQALVVAGRSLVLQGDLKTAKAATDFLLNGLDNDEIQISPDKRAALKQLATSLATQFAETASSLVHYFETFNNELGIQNNTVISKTYELSKRRTGFFLELAGASAFSKNESQKTVGRTGIWLAAGNYFTPANAWHINVRYFFSGPDTAQTNFDTGFGYTKEMSRFTISAEGMVRWYKASVPVINNNQISLQLQRDFTYRLALQTAYAVSQDVSINLSLGKGFTSLYSKTEEFFSLIGFNYTLFKKVAVPVETPK